MEHAALIAGSIAKEISDKTGMTMDWAIECLYANGWTVKEGLEGFEAVKVCKIFFLSFFLSLLCFFFLLAPFPFESTSDRQNSFAKGRKTPWLGSFAA